MESDDRTMTQCFSRVKSMIDAGKYAESDTNKCNGDIRSKKISLSLNDMLASVLGDTDSFEELIPTPSGFRRAKGLQSLVNADDGERVSGRLRSYSCNDRPSQRRIVCDALFTYPENQETIENTLTNEPVTMGDFNTEISKVEDSQKTFNPIKIVRAKTLNSFDFKDRQRKPGVQLKRCLSLYGRERKPHSCYHKHTHDEKVRPSPWTFGASSRISKNGKHHKHKSSTSSLFSCDSLTSNSGSKRSSKVSLASSSSSEFDFDAPQHTQYINCKNEQTRYETKNRSEQVRNLKEAFLKAKDKEAKCSSSIPRPIKKNSETPRSRSSTVSSITLTKTTNKLNNSPDRSNTPIQWSSVKRSVSVLKTASVSSYKAPSTNFELPTYNGVSLFSGSISSDTSSDGNYTKNNTSQREMRNFVSFDEDGYPDVAASSKNKSTIFNCRDFTHVDQIALNAPEDLANSFDELLSYLLENLNTDLSKVRAIYRWLVNQHVPLTLNAQDVVSDTPLGFLYNIRQKRATYSELFATLCRRAEIPCVIIYGIAKSVAYDVGDKVNHKKMKNSWNAVYVEGEWRLVHPYWASQSARGYNSGRWAMVECDAFHNDGDSRQLIAQTVNDFFFLTDPHQFITKCFPDDPSWQLLRMQISKSEFDYLPFLQPAFHELKLKLKTHDSSCVIHADAGRVGLTIQAPLDRIKRYRFTYKLFILRDYEAEGEYDEVLLDRYLLHYVQGDEANFEIRFPVTGVFKLEIHCNDPKRSLPSNWICDYKIICPEPMAVCEPLPVVPSIGWGPGTELDNFGIESLTHKTGIVDMDGEPITCMRFALPKDKDILLEAELLKNNESRTELNTHVTIEQDGDLTVVQVSPPDIGEYALQVYVRDNDGSTGRHNVCNYLMQRSKIVEDPELSDIRMELLTATESGDVDGLQHWIDRFVEKDMADNGDLVAAKKKLHLAKINRDIKEALARKDLDLLERSLQSISGTSIKNQLGALAQEAEAMRSRLRRLKRLCHAVLDMDQKTISELRSYPKPPVAVHGVMAATFLLLGNREVEMKKWSKIQGLISKRGKDSLKRRVANFQVASVKPITLHRVSAILGKYDLESVQIASAGAATFYQWGMTTVSEVQADLDSHT